MDRWKQNGRSAGLNSGRRLYTELLVLLAGRLREHVYRITVVEREPDDIYFFGKEYSEECISMSTASIYLL